MVMPFAPPTLFEDSRTTGLSASQPVSFGVSWPLQSHLAPRQQLAGTRDVRFDPLAEPLPSSSLPLAALQELRAEIPGRLHEVRIAQRIGDAKLGESMLRRAQDLTRT